jgi:hypothetical protein
MTLAPPPSSLLRLDRHELVAAAYLATNDGRLRAAELAAILRLEHVDTDVFGHVTLTLSPEALATMLGRTTGYSERAMGRALLQLERLGWLVFSPGQPLPLRLALPRAEAGRVARHLAELERVAGPDAPLRRARRIVTGTGAAGTAPEGGLAR